MFTRVVNLLTFKGLFSKVRRGEKDPGICPVQKIRRLNGKMLTLLTLLTMMLTFGLLKKPMFMRVVYLLTFKRRLIGGAGGEAERLVLTAGLESPRAFPRRSAAFRAQN